MNKASKKNAGLQESWLTRTHLGLFTRIPPFHKRNLSTLTTSFLPASTFTLVFNLSNDHLSLFTRWLSQFF